MIKVTERLHLGAPCSSQPCHSPRGTQSAAVRIRFDCGAVEHPSSYSKAPGAPQASSPAGPAVHAHLHGRVSRTGRSRILLSRFLLLLGLCVDRVITVCASSSALLLLFLHFLRLCIRPQNRSKFGPRSILPPARPDPRSPDWDPNTLKR